jgi:serine protease Do
MQVTSKSEILMLEELSRAARQVADSVAPSIVRLGRVRRVATAIVIADGRLLTNAHSVYDDTMSIRTVDGRTLETRVVGTDVDGDVAVLAADGVGPALAFAAQVPAIGSPVFAVGMGRGGARLTFGLVSSVGVPFHGPRGRRTGGALEHTAPLAPGSSGSALVNASGHLVGINTQRLGSGFYLALAADEALRARIDRLASGESVERPRLGIAIVPSWVAQRMRSAVGLAPREGLLVREVEPGSPASTAGILVGDLLVGLDGRTLTDPDDLADAIDAAAGTLELRLLRGEAELTLPVPMVTP